MSDKLLSGLNELSSLLDSVMGTPTAPPAPSPPPSPPLRETVDTVGVLIEEGDADAPRFLTVFAALMPGKDFPLEMRVSRAQWLRLAAHAWDTARREGER